MDLMDFDGKGLYFDDELPQEVSSLIDLAADNYGNDDAESYLLRAYFIAPGNLTVLVAMYRFYYYQHQLEDAYKVAERALEISGEQLQMPKDWKRLNESYLGNAVVHSIGLLRFYLLALKGAGYLKLRLGVIQEGMEMLQKVIDMDPHDRLGTKGLLEVVSESDYVTQHSVAI